MPKQLRRVRVLTRRAPELNWPVVRLRPMTEDDLEAVVRLERATFPSPWTPECFAADIRRSDSLALVAEADGRMVGYLVAWHQQELVRLASIAVVPERRGEGIGQHLLAAAEGYARSVGANRFRLEVRLSNIRARSFYLRAEFRQVGLVSGYYGDAEDAVVMERDVRPV